MQEFLQAGAWPALSSVELDVSVDDASSDIFYLIKKQNEIK